MALIQARDKHRGSGVPGEPAGEEGTTMVHSTDAVAKRVARRGDQEVAQSDPVALPACMTMHQRW